MQFNITFSSRLIVTALLQTPLLPPPLSGTSSLSNPQPIFSQPLKVSNFITTCRKVVFKRPRKNNLPWDWDEMDEKNYFRTRMRNIQNINKHYLTALKPRFVAETGVYWQQIVSRINFLFLKSIITLLHDILISESIKNNFQ